MKNLGLAAAIVGVGTFFVGYVIGAKMKKRVVDDICDKVNAAVDDLADKTEVEISDELVAKALNEAVERDTEAATIRISEWAEAQVRIEIAKRVRKIVDESLSNIDRAVKKEVSRQIDAIDISERKLGDEALKKLKEKDINGNMDDILRILKLA